MKNAQKDINLEEHLEENKFCLLGIAVVHRPVKSAKAGAAPAVSVARKCKALLRLKYCRAELDHLIKDLRSFLGVGSNPQRALKNHSPVIGR